jgi:uncharacterized phage protein gp47/JayE
LKDSQTISAAGTGTYSFRAADSGSVTIIPNTITTPTTIVLGVTDIKNPDQPEITGIDQETDAQFRIRIKSAPALASVGFFNSMQSNLLNINDVEYVLVLENNTNSTDSNGVPAHSYWIIVSGGLEADIADVIYTYRSGGSGLKGAEDVEVEQIDGSVFHVYFDRAVEEDLYIQFEIEDIITGNSVDTDYLAQQIVENIKYNINQTANKTDIEYFVKSIYPNVYVKDCQVSNDDSTYTDTLATTAIKNRFILSTDRITISSV